MGILNRQLRSVIEWKNPSPTTLVERWSESGDEIKNASKLVVGPGQGCIFVYEGRVQNVFAQEGLFDLKTGNIPFFTTLFRVMQGFKSEHKVGLYFFKTTKLLNLKWGTSSAIKYEDPKTKLPVGLRAFGNYTLHISDPTLFFRDVVGGRSPFLIDELRDSLNGRLVQPLSDFLAESRFSYTEIDPKREEIAAELSKKLNAELGGLGLALDDFRIQGTSFDEDTMRRINRMADVSAEAQAASSAGVSFSELQKMGALRDAARNPGTAGMGVAMAVGMNLAGGPGGLGAVAGGGAPAPDDASAKLQRLKGLFDQGLITREEYDDKKKQILSQL
jgi:membrane protease subunit (stomatin/prohibitin family)